MSEVKVLTKLQQVWRNCRPNSGEHSTGRHCRASDDCGKNLSGKHVQQSGGSQDAKSTQQHQDQGEIWITCKEDGRL